MSTSEMERREEEVLLAEREGAGKRILVRGREEGRG
jgi:hypothetical protein